MKRGFVFSWGIWMAFGSPSALAQAVPDGDFEEGEFGTWSDTSDAGASVEILADDEDMVLALHASDSFPMSDFARVESATFVVTHDQLSFDAQPQSQETGFSLSLLDTSGIELTADVFLGDASVWDTHHARLCVTDVVDLSDLIAGYD